MSETKDIKITSAEKTKDPRRVEAGKKLGAIWKQAKEKKASESGASKVESQFKIPSFDPLTAIGVVGVVGVVGMVMYYGYCKHSKEPVSAKPQSCEPAQAKQAETPAPASEAKPVLKQLDTLD